VNHSRINVCIEFIEHGLAVWASFQMLLFVIGQWHRVDQVVKQRYRRDVGSIFFIATTGTTKGLTPVRSAPYFCLKLRIPGGMCGWKNHDRFAGETVRLVEGGMNKEGDLFS
jgi:hypothetical protein